MTTARKRATAGSGGGGRWAGGVAATNRALAAAFIDEQLYFVSAAQFWCKPPAQAMVVDRDRVHATSALRVHGPMSQFREFASAFRCPRGAPYHPPPGDRCELY